MMDPYTRLGEELARAAERRAAPGNGSVKAGAAGRRLRGGRPRVVVAAIALLLACSAVAAAATGFLNGAPVKPEVTPNPNAGNGVPVGGGKAAQLALVAADPTESLPWGLRVLKTTRGQTCVQVGRVQGGRIGELGLDSAFDGDGRFHPLPAAVLPPGYGGAAGFDECVDAGQTLIFEDAKADRSAVRLLPEEFAAPHAERIAPPAKHPGPPAEGPTPPARDLRAVAYGLLGAHAISVTYRTGGGLHTVPVSPPAGAFLIVEPAGQFGRPSEIGGSMSGEARRGAVDVLIGGLPKVRPSPIVSAVTFRFGGRVCSQGVGAPVRTPCPRGHQRAANPRPFNPTRSLHEPVGLKLLPQSQAECAAAFLRDPCYKGQVSFRVPYAVRGAGTDYNVDAIAKCKVGGRPETSWDLERDVKAHELVTTVSLGKFVYTPSCAPTESFRVSYVNLRGPARATPHESVIVGSVKMSKATFAGGAPKSSKR